MEIVKLKPATKDYIWGGSKLKKYGKESANDVIAETWELSFHPDGPSLIDSGVNKGQLLKDVVTRADLGTYVQSFPFFPVLVKLIDAKDNLSVQVHPSDEYALKNENSFGKTEMWYVLEAEKDAGLYVGLKKDETRDSIQQALNDGTILSKLNFFKVKPGEVYFIKSGTIHAIGKGVMVMEIQQNSNLTYRLYDYHRVGKDGKERPLHIEKALKVIDFHAYSLPKNPENLLGKCKYFTSYLCHESNNMIQTDETSFASITFIEGEGFINDLPFKKFDTFFIPCSKIAKIVSFQCTYVLTKVEQ